MNPIIQFPSINRNNDDQDDLIPQERPIPYDESVFSVLDAATRVDPSRLATTVNVSRRLGLPQDMVDRNLDEAIRLAKLRDSQEWMQKTYVLYEMMRQPGFAASAHDDIQNLAAIEQSAYGLSQGIRDIGVAALRGVGVSFPKLLAGLYRYSIWGLTDKALGGRTQEEIDRGVDIIDRLTYGLYSAERIQRLQELAEKRGFFEKLKYSITTPAVTIPGIVESIPITLASGYVGGAILGAASKIPAIAKLGWAKNLVAPASFGLAEGAMSALSQMGEPTGNDFRNALAALGAGFSTALISTISGGIASRIGVDPDVALGALLTGKSVSAGTRKMVAARMLYEIASEGLLEEMPQSMLEQMFANYAANRPLFDGVDSAAAMGLVTGMAMASAVSPLQAINERRVEHTAKMLKAAAQSNLAKALPEAFDGFVNKVATQYGIGSAYLQTDDILSAARDAKMSDEDLNAWFKKLGISNDDLVRSMVSGGNIKISLGEFLRLSVSDEIMKRVSDKVRLSQVEPAVTDGSMDPELIKYISNKFKLSMKDEIHDEDVIAWKNAIRSNKKVAQRVRPEHLDLMIARANMLSQIAGGKPIEHLNRMLKPENLRVTTLRQFSDEVADRQIRARVAIQESESESWRHAPAPQNVAKGYRLFSATTENGVTILRDLKTGKEVPIGEWIETADGKTWAIFSDRADPLNVDNSLVYARVEYDRDTASYQGTFPGGKSDYSIARRIRVIEVVRDISQRGNGSNGISQQESGDMKHDQDSMLYQIHTINEWEAALKDWLDRNGIKGKRRKKIEDNIRGARALVDSLEHFKDLFPHNPDALKLSPIRPNADKHLYVRSLDLAASCLRRLEYGANLELATKLMGRLPTNGEAMLIVIRMVEAGKTSPCLYCYIESPRRAYVEWVMKYIDMLAGRGALKPNDEARQLMADMVKDGFDPNEIDYGYFMRDEYTSEHVEKFKKYYEFIHGKAQSMSRQNKVKVYVDYSGQLLALADKRWSETNGERFVDWINKRAGMRIFSSSDFQIEHVVDLVQAVIDMYVVGMLSHAYTKTEEFVEVFGDTGMKIQMSIFATELDDGTIVPNEDMGMKWASAKRLREKHANAGTVLVATSDNIVKWGLEQDWIDYIIPFHSSMFPASWGELMEWVNYTGVQHEKPVEKGKPFQRTIMQEFAGRKGVDNATLTKRYLKLCKERGIKPPFEKFLYREDGSINPNYAKLRKDYARTDTPFEVADPSKINFEIMRKLLDEFIENGGRKVVPDEKFVHEVLAEIRNGIDIERELAMFNMRRREYLRSVASEKFYTQGEFPMASYTRIGKDNIIALFSKSDRSSFIHEAAHLFLEDIKYMSTVHGVQNELWDGIRNWLGIPEDGRITREQHEKFAKHFEAYVMEGKAPSSFLRRAFATMRRWLLSIYRSIKGRRLVGVTVTPEISSLFDMMLATQEEIEEIREVSATVEIITESLLSRSGLSRQLVDKYLQALDAEKERMTMELFVRRSNEYSEKIKQWRARAEREASKIPLFRLIADHHGHIDASTAADKYNVDTTRHAEVYGENGIDIDHFVAIYGEQYGYTDGGELANDLNGIKPRDEWIKDRVSQFEQAYKNRTRPPSVIASANTAMRMEYESRILAELAKVKGSRRLAEPTPAREMYDYAYSLLSQATMRRLPTITSLVANIAKQRKRAIKALANDDPIEALDANEKARMNEALILARMAIDDEIRKVKRVIRKSTRATGTIKRGQYSMVSEDYAQQMKRILSVHGIARRQYDPSTPSLKDFILQNFSAQDPIDVAAAFPEWIGSEPVALKDMPVERIVSLGKALAYLYEHGSDDVKTMRMREEERDAADADAMKNTIQIIPPKQIASDARALTRMIRRFQQAKRKYLAGTNLLRYIAQRIDGYSNVGAGGKMGVAENMFQDIVDGYAKSADAWLKISMRLEPLIHELAARKINTSDLRVPDIMKKHGMTWTKERVVMACLHMGTESNYQRLVDGYDLTEADVFKLMSKLTMREWQIIREIWDIADSLWPDMAKTYRNMNYVYPERLPRSVITVNTAEGDTLTMEGGYFPLMYDPKLDVTVAELSEKEQILDQSAVYAGISSKIRASMTRAVKFAKPLDLSISVLGRYFSDVIRYVNLAEPVRRMDRVLRRPEIRNEIIDRLGRDVYDIIRPALKHAYKPDSGDVTWLTSLSSKMGTYYMGYYLWTAAQNITGFFSAVWHIGLRPYITGLYRMMVDGPVRSYEFVRNLSLYMRMRMKNVERDMKKALSDFKPDTGLQAQLAKAHHLTKEGAFALIRFIDTIVSIPGWIGKYHQAMEETDGDMHASIRAADSAINMAIGSGLPFDATAIMRHKYLSMFAFFFSFAVHQQESMAVAAEARRYGAISTMDYIHSRLLLWIFPSIGTTMMYYVLVNGGAGDEEKRKDLLKSLMIDLMSYRTMGLPFTRDIVTALSRGIKGERSVATAKVPTIEGFTILLRSAFATGRAISQWDEKSINMLILAICESISLWSNVPFTQVYKRIQKGLEAMRRGEGWAGSLFIPPKQ